MTTIITLFGLAIGFLIFVNLLHTKAKIEGQDLSVEEQDSPLNLLKNKKKSRVLENAPNRRICPICKTVLLQEEYLLCAMEPERKNNVRRQVHIYGCPHCFITSGVNVSNSDTVDEAIETLKL